MKKLINGFVWNYKADPKKEALRYNEFILARDEAIERKKDAEIRDN